MDQDESEFVSNVFDCLASSLLVPENQQLFTKAEGVELMLILIKYVHIMSLIFSADQCADV